MSHELKAPLQKQLLNLINGINITEDQVKEIIRMSEPKTKMLGRDGQHLYSTSDITGRCPTCSISSVTKIGQLSIDGTEQDVNKCNQCNKLFSGADGGIRSLLEEAAKVYESDNVGFTSLNNATNNSQATQQSTITVNDYVAQSSLNNINSSVISVSDQIKNLVTIVQNLVQQNHQLMEKLATDPLNGMRKAINNFNLE